MWCRRDSIRTVLGAVLASSIFAGCTPSDSSGASAQATPAASTAGSVLPGNSATCAVLTAAKASAVLHSTVTLKVATGKDDGRSICTYTYSGGGWVEVDLATVADAQQQYEAAKSGAPAITDVSGVGDKAFDGPLGLGAVRGNHFVRVVGPTPGVQLGRQKLAQALFAAL